MGKQCWVQWVGCLLSALMCGWFDGSRDELMCLCAAYLITGQAGELVNSLAGCWLGCLLLPPPSLPLPLPLLLTLPLPLPLSLPPPQLQPLPRPLVLSLSLSLALALALALALSLSLFHRQCCCHYHFYLHRPLLCRCRWRSAARPTTAATFTAIGTSLATFSSGCDC